MRVVKIKNTCFQDVLVNCKYMKDMKLQRIFAIPEQSMGSMVINHYHMTEASPLTTEA